MSLYCGSILPLFTAVIVTLSNVLTPVEGQNPYDLEARSVSFPGKPSSLGPLYSPGLGVSQAFRDNSYEDNAVTPTPPAQSVTAAYRNSNSQQQQALYRKPTGSSIDSSRDYQAAIRVGGGGGQQHHHHHHHHHQQQQQQQQPQQQQQQRTGSIRGGLPLQYGQNRPAEELLEEKEEPDRLTLLLPQSKFDCVNKQTGYYADEDLNCEVFHYCHDNAKHSWICPEGFTFHQVHLICMPPSGDINCKKSSQYHFVNEYLYKPLNLAEAENKPNVTLRYSERYYPADFHTDEREVGDYQISPSTAPVRRPVSQAFAAQQSTLLNSIPPSSVRPQSQGLPHFRLPVNQVFRSPEEVNIPLQHRRPQSQQEHNQQQQQHQQQHQQHQQAIRRFPQVRPDEEDYE